MILIEGVNENVALLVFRRQRDSFSSGSHETLSLAGIGGTMSVVIP